jgi:hypothetical protein
VNRGDRSGTESGSTVIVITRNDPYANSVKPKAIAEKLQDAGFRVHNIDSVSLGRASTIGVRRWLPRLTLPALLLYVNEALSAITRALLSIHNSRLTRHLNGTTLAMSMEARGRYLAKHFEGTRAAALICESQWDQAVVLGRIATKQILDLPSPFADELLFGGRISHLSHMRLRDIEERSLAKAERVSFHWHTYDEYVRTHYKVAAHWLPCGYGVTAKAKRATYSREPRVVFLGSLNGSWTNVPLLEILSAQYPLLDVWGGPPPKGLRHIRYQGYAPSLDVLADYQIGLVTITDDPLRRMSFSSKQLEYFSYGLPVLVPDWRTDTILAPGTIPYNETDFLEKVHTMRDPIHWQTMSQQALTVAESLDWDTALNPLIEFLADEEGPDNEAK